jgi:uncharacterized membrane protein YfcA
MLVLVGLAQVGGIGGGGVIIPICISCFGFSIRFSIALSNAIIFTGCVARYFIFSCRDKHPTIKNKSLIDHSLTAIMLP